MSDIPTHKINLPISNKTVVLKDWITGVDDERIQAHYYNGGQVNAAGNVTYTGETMAAADHEAWLAAVVSVDGSSDDIVEAIRNLPLPDYKIVSREVKKVVNPLVMTEGEDSEKTTPAT
jgi:hypothetical protein